METITVRADCHAAAIDAINGLPYGTRARVRLVEEHDGMEPNHWGTVEVADEYFMRDVFPRYLDGSVGDTARRVVHRGVSYRWVSHSEARDALMLVLDRASRMGKGS